VADRIEGYWLAKSGSRSRQAFSAMLEELSAVAARAGQRLWIDRAQPRSYPKLNKPAIPGPLLYCRNIWPFFTVAFDSPWVEMPDP
jgi:hypothetical protein